MEGAIAAVLIFGGGGDELGAFQAVLISAAVAELSVASKSTRASTIHTGRCSPVSQGNTSSNNQKNRDVKGCARSGAHDVSLIALRRPLLPSITVSCSSVANSLPTSTSITSRSTLRLTST
jgi:hypothetical protein